jgi:excisionase family DNA binding protein
MEKLLTLEEVAELLSISLSTAKVYASRRVFPVIKLGRLVRVSALSLEEWLRRNTLDSDETACPRKKSAVGSVFEARVRELKKGAL